MTAWPHILFSIVLKTNQTGVEVHTCSPWVQTFISKWGITHKSSQWQKLVIYIAKQICFCFHWVNRHAWLTGLLCDGIYVDEVCVSGGCLFGQSQPSFESWTELRSGWCATNQHWAFITSHNLVVGFLSGLGKCGCGIRWWSWLCCRACVKSNGFTSGSREGEASEKLTEQEKRAPAGRQAVQPLPALGFLRRLKYASYF